MRNENVKPLDIFWNTVGTCTYAIISLVLSIVVINIAGKTEGGIFTFGFSTLARLAFTLTFFTFHFLFVHTVKIVVFITVIAKTH